MKDRLIQTRVPERLESILKEEAQKRRLTVSHLIRNMLEDTLQLVDTVVSGAGGIVGDSVELAESVVRDAGKIASTAREAARTPRGNAPRKDAGSRSARRIRLDHVLAWNQVVVNRPAECSGCEGELPRGSAAHLGVSQDPTKPPCWLCDTCLKNL